MDPPVIGGIAALAGLLVPPLTQIISSRIARRAVREDKVLPPTWTEMREANKDLYAENRALREEVIRLMETVEKLNKRLRAEAPEEEP